MWPRPHNRLSIVPLPEPSVPLAYLAIDDDDDADERKVLQAAMPGDGEFAFEIHDREHEDQRNIPSMVR